jgi:hypothetical protein
MSAAALAIADLLAQALPGPTWSVQFPKWSDQGPSIRYAVIRPAGGGGGDLVRRPQFTLSLIGQSRNDTLPMSAAAELVVTLLRRDAGALVFLQPAEPVFLSAADGRPIFEIALSAITNP